MIVYISGNLTFNTNNGQTNIRSQSQTQLNLYSNTNAYNSYGYIELNQDSQQHYTIIAGNNIEFRNASHHSSIGESRLKILYNNEIIMNCTTFKINGTVENNNYVLANINTQDLINYTLSIDLYTRSQLHSGNLDLSFNNIDISGSLNVISGSLNAIIINELYINNNDWETIEITNHNFSSKDRDNARFNTFIGYDCANSLVNSQRCTGFGNNALSNITTGDDNTVFGYNGLYKISTGCRNVAIGSNAGYINLLIVYN